VLWVIPAFLDSSLALGQRLLHTRLLSDSEIRLVPKGAQLWAEYGVELEVDELAQRVPLKATGEVTPDSLRAGA